jgi:hypothetical protein
MMRFAKIAGLYTLELILAIVGPTIIESPFLPVHAPRARILSEWCLSIVIAALLGFLADRSRQPAESRWIWGPKAFRGRRVSKWLWVTPALWSVCYLWSSGRGLLVSGRFWTHFSGFDCAIDRWSCIDFYACTVPLLRTIAFSLAAFLSSLSATSATEASAQFLTDEDPNQQPTN